MIFQEKCFLSPFGICKGKPKHLVEIGENGEKNLVEIRYFGQKNLVGIEKWGKSLSQQTQLHRPTKQDALADTYGFVGR